MGEIPVKLLYDSFDTWRRTPFTALTCTLGFLRFSPWPCSFLYWIDSGTVHPRLLTGLTRNRDQLWRHYYVCRGDFHELSDADRLHHTLLAAIRRSVRKPLCLGCERKGVHGQWNRRPV